MIPDSSSVSGKQCLICGKVFATTGSANRHFKMTHSGDLVIQGKSPPCFLCGKRFKHENILKDHLRKKHQVYQPQYDEVYCHKAQFE